jgi:hypothetical protein
MLGAPLTQTSEKLNVKLGQSTVNLLADLLLVEEVDGRVLLVEQTTRVRSGLLEILSLGEQLLTLLNELQQGSRLLKLALKGGDERRERVVRLLAELVGILLHVQATFGLRDAQLVPQALNLCLSSQDELLHTGILLFEEVLELQLDGVNELSAEAALAAQEALTSLIAHTKDIPEGLDATEVLVDLALSAALLLRKVLKVAEKPA